MKDYKFKTNEITMRWNLGDEQKRGEEYMRKREAVKKIVCV